MKSRIHIIGGPGSGKSYVATKMAKYFDVPACNLDDLFWDSRTHSYGVRAEPSERDERLAKVVSQDGWIIEGVYYQWLARSFRSAHIVVALTPSIWIRHRRVIRRFILRRLGRIPSRHESFADLWRLLCWSHGYDRNNLVPAREFIAAHGRRPIDCKTFDEVMAATLNLTNS